MANLFTSQTPVLADNSDGTPGITTATTIVFAVDGTVAGVRFYATTTVGGTYTGALWEVTDNDAGTGTLLASKTMGGSPTGGTWNTITFDTPVSVTAGTPYRVGIFSGAGRYVATVGFFVTSLTNGDIFAPANNGGAGPYTVFQGTFAINAALTYPTSSAGSACYFADVEFTPDGVDPAVPDGLAVPLALGAPSSAAAITTAPDGLAVPAALGAPSVSAAISAAPNGLALPITLGAPSTAAVGATPDGLAAPLALGQPSGSAAVSAAPGGLAVPVSLGEPAIIASASPNGLTIAVSLGAPEVTYVNTAGGGWHDFAGIIAGARADHEINEERRRHPVECPEHGWPLDANSRGILHCQFGGHVVAGSR